MEDKIKVENLENMSMLELLDFFKNKSNNFSLSTSYNSGYDINHPFGKYKLDQKMANKIINETLEYFKKENRMIYEKLDKQKFNLPTFEKFIEHVESINKIDLTKIIDGMDLVKNSLCDKFSRKELQYKEPLELWHIYHSYDFLNEVRFSAMNMVKLNECRQLDYELNLESYIDLKNCLIKIDITHIWHCTVSGLLCKVFYFKLNKDSIHWLLKHKNIYDFIKLDDLAFYQDDKCIFSSCTHEGFCNYLNK